MKKLTLKELQSNFDAIMDNVTDGQSYEIQSEEGNFILMPYKQYEEIDELIRIHTDLNNEAQ